MLNAGWQKKVIVCIAVAAMTQLQISQWHVWAELVFSMRKEHHKAISLCSLTETHCWHTHKLIHKFTGSSHYSHPSSPSAGSAEEDSQEGGSSSGLAHDRWQWFGVWATLCVWDLPAKVGQKGTPTASLFVIPCMALCGSLGSASSFSQE